MQSSWNSQGWGQSIFSGWHPDWKKIHATIDMSSITGRLRSIFGAVFSVTLHAEISAHIGKINFGAW